jgi:hypothetical protein
MILSKKKECSKDLIAIELEIDRCTVIQEDEDEENENDDGENENDDEENENDDEKEEIKYEKQDSIVNSSMTSLSFRATKSFQTTASFENYLINELQSINKKLGSIDKRFNLIDKRFNLIDKRFNLMDKRLSRIEKQSAITYEIASERRVVHSLRSLGMTSISGLSGEFYHVDEYRTVLYALAYDLINKYCNRWAMYNRYVDISLCPQAIEINLMGKLKYYNSL